MHLDFLKHIALAIDVLALTVILIGLVVSVIQFARSQTLGLRGSAFSASMTAVRCTFGSYLLLGLEFMIASDITRTINEPTYKELIILGSIVLIRTIVSHFLNKEIQETQAA
jgi:uncharacterized membrane protein